MKASMMAEFNEELEPLFDYSRVQPHNVVFLDDEDDDEDVVCVTKKRKTSEPVVESGSNGVKAVQVVDCEEKEDDWLRSPPKVSNDAHEVIEDSTLKALRLKKQELVLFAQSAKNMIQTVEECAKREMINSSQSSMDVVCEKKLKPSERAKILISVQDKDGLKQFRMYMDDNFERFFKMYADKVKLDLKHLVFTFDGDKISPSATPNELGMEDNDIIEVHVKSS